MQHRTLIIAGMHRSGTSLITNWLNKCGLQLGEHFVGPGHGNWDGHYEDVEFLKLHEEILADNNLPPSGLTEQHDMDISIYHKEKLKTIIRLKNRLYHQWGWKDPRTCLFFDTYKELLPDARYLIIIRDFRSVVSSLLQRDFTLMEKKYLNRNYLGRMVWKKIRRKRRLEAFYKFKADEYLKVWLAYNEEILKNIKVLAPDKYVVLNFSVLNKNDAELCTYLKKDWNLSLKYFKFQDVYKETMVRAADDIDAFVADRSLITRADELENQLRDYMVMV